jgi:hypothetical protein
MLPIRTKKWAFIPLILRYIDLKCSKKRQQKQEEKKIVERKHSFLHQNQIEKNVAFLLADLFLNNAFCSLVIFVPIPFSCQIPVWRWLSEMFGLNWRGACFLNQGKRAGNKGRLAAFVWRSDSPPSHPLRRLSLFVFVRCLFSYTNIKLFVNSL